MSEATIFAKIINKEIAADIVYEDELCLAFHDIAPQAPVHIILIPKQAIDKIANAKPTDQALLGHLMLQAGEIARQQNIAENFRLVVNNGAAAGQTVFHLHIHILGGRDLSWPPG
jgi:histidine triad (HIT) family protein